MYISAKTIVNGMTRNEAKTVLKKIHARFGNLPTTKPARAPDVSAGELEMLRQGNRIGAIAEYSGRTGKSLLVAMRAVDKQLAEMSVESARAHS